jgi:GLPGLI family protein
LTNSLKFLILIIVFTVFVDKRYSFAQNIPDNAYLLCTYKVIIVSDTNKRQNTQEDMAGLEISKNMSRYFSIYHEERTREQAEWKKNNGDKPMDVSAIFSNYKKRGLRIKIYKNYKSNQLTVFDNIANETFTFEEENPDFGWKILPDTMQILKQVCQKATCQFRGRKYEAWFAQGINVSEGPWKFYGLPGLILKVIDSNQDYSFEAISLEKIDYPIAPKPTKAIVSKRTVFNRIYKEFAANPAGFANANQQEEMSKNSNDPFVQKLMKFKFPYNPMELTDN